MPMESQILVYASKYDVSYEEIYKTIKCESNFNPEAVGDSGRARGVAQFWRITFDAYNQEYFNGKLEYLSTEDQINLMAKMFSEGEQKHWVCFKKVVSL